MQGIPQHILEEEKRAASRLDGRRRHLLLLGNEGLYLIERWQAERHSRNRSAPEASAGAKSVLAVIMLLTVIVTGCVTAHRPHTSTPATMPNDSLYLRHQQLLASTHCGVLHVAPPLTNVSATFTVPTKPEAVARLLIAPNTTLEGALYAAANCAPLGVVPISRSLDVTFLNLPAGAYVAVLPANAFRQGQGFPIIHEYESSESSVVMEFYGGNQDYSLAVFTIRPIHDEFDAPGGNLTTG